MSTFLAIVSKLEVRSGRILAFYIKKIFTEERLPLIFIFILFALDIPLEKINMI
jgi:hypothetical protein